uniref:Uncharacterized protein n=1 Tax=Glossina palpalis gambiensis TaxID=67801 RepID=A0A1B0AWI2_9MUSC
MFDVICFSNNGTQLNIFLTIYFFCEFLKKRDLSLLHLSNAARIFRKSYELRVLFSDGKGNIVQHYLTVNPRGLEDCLDLNFHSGLDEAQLKLKCLLLIQSIHQLCYTIT